MYRYPATSGFPADDYSLFTSFGLFNDDLTLGQVLSGSPVEGVKRSLSLEAHLITTQHCDKGEEHDGQLTINQTTSCCPTTSSSIKKIVIVYFGFLSVL